MSATFLGLGGISRSEPEAMLQSTLLMVHENRLDKKNGNSGNADISEGGC